MSANWEKRTPADYETAAWSGGTTTQLLIAPEGANYAARDFLWRVSSATVELGESDFTPLPDYERLIATLRGEITLTHNGGAPLRLHPFEVHAFSGSERTHSSGRCTDFNLILRRGRAAGTMEAVLLGMGERREFAPDGTSETLLYAVEGVCTVMLGSERIELQIGESLRVCSGASLALEGREDAALMLCRMRRL